MTVKINDTLVTSNDLQGQTADYFDTGLKLLAPSSSDDKIKRLLSCDAEKQYLQYKAQQSIPYDLSTTNYISVTQQPEDNTELFTNVLSINRCLPFNLSFNVSSDAISAGTRYLLEQPNLLQCKSQDNTLYFKIPAWENAWKKVDSSVLSNNNSVSLEASNDGTTLVKNYYAYTNSDTYYIDTEIPAEESTFILQNATIVGTLTDNDGIYSGFSTSNYFLTDNNFNPQSSNWEIIIKFKTSNDISTQQAIIGGGGAYSKIILEVYNGHFRLRISSNNSSFNVFDDFGTYDVQTNTDYIIRCRYNNTTGYTMEYKTLDGSYQLDSSTSNITAIYDSSTPLSLGANKYNSSGVNVPFSGNIDMSQTSIMIDGVTTNFGPLIPKSIIYQKIDNDFNKLIPQPAFTAKVLGLSNATNNGCTDLGNGIYQGGSGKYFVIDDISSISTADSWEFITKFTNTGSGINTILAPSQDRKNFILTIDNNVVKFHACTGGGVWNLYSGSLNLSVNNSVTYFYKLSYNSTTGYSFTYKTNKEDSWNTPTWTLSDTRKVDCTVDEWLLNFGGFTTSQYGTGPIDLSETKFIIDGVTTNFWSDITSITFGNTEYIRNIDHDDSEDIYVANQLQLKVNNATYTLVDNMDDMPIITTGTLAIREDLK